MKRYGLSDSEITELVVGANKDDEEDMEFQKSVKDSLTINDLVKKEKLGTLSMEEENELDSRLGNCRITIGDKTYKVNHCLIARIILAALMLGMILSIIVLCTIEIAKNK